MNPKTMIAVILIVAGVAALAYGQFSYTKETHEAKIGTLELSVKEQETVNIPKWLGIGAIVAGVVLLVIRRK